MKKNAAGGKKRTFMSGIYPSTWFFCTGKRYDSQVRKKTGWWDQERPCLKMVGMFQEGEAMEGSTACLQSRGAHSFKGRKKGEFFGTQCWYSVKEGKE